MPDHLDIAIVIEPGHDRIVITRTSGHLTRDDIWAAEAFMHLLRKGRENGDGDAVSS